MKTLLILFFSFFTLGLSSTLAAMDVNRGVALVYHGPGACDGCDTSLGVILLAMGFEVQYVGPSDITPEGLSKAAIYVQPGGSDRVADVLDALKAASPASRPEEKYRLIQSFVFGGGAYLGVCSGAYLAGDLILDAVSDPVVEPSDPYQVQHTLIHGFGLLPGSFLFDEGILNSATFTTLPQVKKLKQEIGPSCPGSLASVYHQDGPQLISQGDGLRVWARFQDTDHVAALTARARQGKVALLSSHLEATPDWFQEDHLPVSADIDCNIAFLKEMIDAITLKSFDPTRLHKVSF